MKELNDLLSKVYYEGKESEDRTGIGTLRLFGTRMEFNLQDGFPVPTTKKFFFKSMAAELLWFLEGSSDERRLAEILHGTRDSSKHTIWTQNANADYWKDKASFEGDVGRIYGVQWRQWQGVDGQEYDQVRELLKTLKKEPTSRRMLINAWNSAELHKMALPPCHVLSQFFVEDNTLSCQLYQRSADMFLGVPFDIASYSLLTHLIAHVMGMKVGKFIWVGGDTHIYLNHLEQVREQLRRQPYRLPQLKIHKDVSNLFDFTLNDFSLENYQFHPSIPAPMAV
jgi:thymidylate synthase